MILGVSGPNAAGKGEAVAFLRARSFEVHSLSDVLREELERRGEQETRERMIALGRELREQGGPGVLAERIASKLHAERNHAVDSIRHPAEVEVLRQLHPSFRLIWIDAPLEQRFQRIRDRARSGDPETLDDLRRLEGAELGSADPAAQQLLAVRDLADERVENRSDLETLYSSLQAVLKKGLYFERPGWDAYFMDIARVVASRSNCVKRKVAAVITLDKRIIATGYNGTPRGVRNCNEGGCPRCNSFAPGGTQLGECLCSHGEENAIVQAAYHGVSVKGATLYTTLCPCLLCTKMMINAGIGEVVYNAQYPLGELSLELLEAAGVKARRYEATQGSLPPGT
jgi:dCMP deaminase